MEVIETAADIWKSTETIVVLHAGLNDIQNNDASQNLTEKIKSQITSWTARAKGYFFVFCGVPEVGPKDDAMRTKCRRYSAAKSYLRPIVKKRANLHLSLRSHAVKILFENQRAVGVQFKKQGTLLHRKVRARREIILSGGTIGSTQLLLLSGVGPARDLEELGIPVVANLPVGENLQDHMFMGGMAATTDVDAGLHPQNIDVVKEYARTKAVQTQQIGW
ncbi:hypothetical protein MRX96_057338 [Rhipicephalus microplus]